MMVVIVVVRGLQYDGVTLGIATDSALKDVLEIANGTKCGSSAFETS